MNNRFGTIYLSAALSLLVTACSTQKQTAKLANKALLHQPELAAAHVGISIMDANTGKYIYNYQGDKYFIPASNTKLLTCYAAMKYLGDSLVGLRYEETAPGTVLVQATGDPTLLHPDFKTQPVFNFLKSKDNIIPWEPNRTPGFRHYGKGWAWDDYKEDYMAERSELPIYGNCTPAAIPFKTIENGQAVAWKMFEDTLGKKFGDASHGNARILPQLIHSQPTDTLLKIMMHRSDNFFAEQSLLMVSNTALGYMNDKKIIDSLVKTDYAAMPQAPQWVDGSGLSRYNLVTPQDFVWLLNKMKKDFSWQRITGILQTGGQGTLSSYYKKYAGRIYAKTGTLSNNVALSGYLLTNKGKTLAFSIIVNNHKAAVSNIRREVEAFLGSIIEKY